MRKFLVLLFLCLLQSVALAAPPAEVVERVYKYHQKVGNQHKTVKDNRACFTPAFYDVLTRAYARSPESGDFVDFDVFFNAQDDGFAYRIGKTSIQGKNATVEMVIYQKAGHRGTKQDGPSQKVSVQLSDVGQGFQIQDIIHHMKPPMSIRKIVTEVADGKK